jgi:type I restriction-modification system DNA methylase subunit
MFPSLRIEGNILSDEILARIESGNYAGQTAQDFGLDGRARLKDEIAYAWATARDHWSIFTRKLGRLPDDATATTETRADWIIPLLRLLGYDLTLAPAETVQEKTYAISHRDMERGGFPVHIAGFRDDLDWRRKDGGPRLSPHGLIQEYLNQTEHLYGLVTNGRYLRLLRDSGRLVKLSFAEFDLVRMMDDELYADFALMFRLLHRSRMPQRMDGGAESRIERCHQDSLDAGSRIRDRLSSAVENSILAFGNGFLGHKANTELREQVSSGVLTADAYYQHLLRLIYRFLFLLVSEERDLIFPDSGDDETTKHRDVYYAFYSLQRLRRLSERPCFDEEKHDDLWESLKTTFSLFESEKAGRVLGIMPLGGDLFAPDALGPMADARLENDVLLMCLRQLCEFENERKQTVRVNYGSLDVEEFGSVYEGLLELDALFEMRQSTLQFIFKEGSRRSTSGSHYTPEELVQPLIRHALDPVIEHRLKDWKKYSLPDDGTGADAQRAAKRRALLGIAVCDPACGSGHILLSAARRIATELTRVETGEEQPSPKAFRAAMREVIRHCLHGVDINPLAVELCKVALWLEAHNPGLPLSFLDHRIRCGDAVVGVARVDELFAAIPEPAYKTLQGDDKNAAKKLRNAHIREVESRTENGQGTIAAPSGFDESLKALAADAAAFIAQPEESADAYEQRRAAFEKMHDGQWRRIKGIADLRTAVCFIPKTPGTISRIATDEAYGTVIGNQSHHLQEMTGLAADTADQRRFFHWFVEFPDVMERGGFDCVLGNPPFLGNRGISGYYGNSYLNWLTSNNPPSKAVELVTYFFRRAYEILLPDGFMGLIATNTIAQGSARETGLEYILSNKGTITFAIRSMPWPGLAAVEVALVAIRKGNWLKQKILGIKTVSHISAYLDDVAESINPYPLKANEGKSFIGSYVLGLGFVLEPHEAEVLISKDSRNKDVLFPYLNGEDLNSRPDQSASRWVINFFDWPLDRTAKGSWFKVGEKKQKEWIKTGTVPKDYPGKVAADYPDCLDIVERLVKPERQRKNENGHYALRKPLPQRWWHYADKRPGLYRAIAPLERVLVVARTSKILAFTFTNRDIVLSANITAIASDSEVVFGVLQSSIHAVWVWKYCTTLESRLIYGPIVAFETFPFPAYFHTGFDSICKSFDQLRKTLFIQTNTGITSLYNVLNEPKPSASSLQLLMKQNNSSVSTVLGYLDQLRDLHRQMDLAVRDAYGWSDLDLEHGFHEVAYLPENDRVRYTISERARKEVLRRLLNLNHQRRKEEEERGEWR